MYIFGKDLEALRLYGGFTKKKLSEELNVCAKTIKNYESDRSSPTVNEFIKMAKLCGLNETALSKCLSAQDTLENQLTNFSKN